MGPARRAWLVGIGALVIVGALAPLAVEQHVLNSIDTAVKLVQAEELRRSSFVSMAISYPARDLDPAELFLPFVPPFIFLSSGHHSDRRRRRVEALRLYCSPCAARRR